MNLNTPIQITAAIIGIVILLAAILFGCPKYNVYRKTMEGKATLEEAKYSKDVKIAEANATMESSILLAKADSIRAVGIAKANAIIGNSLRNNKVYLDWLWIDNIKDNQNVIYVPTEANLPILEAGRGVKGEVLDKSKIKGTANKIWDE